MEPSLTTLTLYIIWSQLLYNKWHAIQVAISISLVPGPLIDLPPPLIEDMGTMLLYNISISMQLHKTAPKMETPLRTLLALLALRLSMSATESDVLAHIQW